jgi:hypothetical protein
MTDSRRLSLRARFATIVARFVVSSLCAFSQVENTIYAFATGEFPVPGVTLDVAGNIYAATEDGGPSRSPCTTANSVAECGSVWQFVASASGQWTSRLLHVLNGGSDGRMLDRTSL